MKLRGWLFFCGRRKNRGKGIRILGIPTFAFAGLLFVAGPGPGMKNRCLAADNFMFGNDVVIADRVFKEKLTLAGANVDVGGKLEKGLNVFGASVSVPAEVHSGVNAFGAHVVLSGTYYGPVNAAAANLVLSGVFEEDVEAAGAKITLAPTVVIKKNIRYNSAVFDRREGAAVLGEVVRGDPEFEESIEVWKEKGKDVWKIASFSLWLISAAALLITGLIIGHLFPHQTERAVGTISGSPWSDMVTGLVVLIGAPLVIFICLITVVGIPVALMAGMVYAVSIYLSRIYFALWIGRKAIGYIKRSPPTTLLWPLAFGILLIYLTMLIPFFGWIARFFILLIGLGAFWTVVRQGVKSGKMA